MLLWGLLFFRSSRRVCGRDPERQAKHTRFKTLASKSNAPATINSTNHHYYERQELLPPSTGVSVQHVFYNFHCPKRRWLSRQPRQAHGRSRSVDAGAGCETAASRVRDASPRTGSLSQDRLRRAARLARSV